MEMPATLQDFIWYLLLGTSGFLLWSIKAELKGLREDLKDERTGREALAIEVAGIKARCLAYHNIKE